ncbi:hypothetical protein AAE02nite_16250 [Adhaeribacter aerolatus]|uniref:Uncharacterized protein n=1 Tax=Adhaeribacter aerolatus TaxID=670289 RepID=A0A512AW73_9BACT|nr:hypothetical protein [Adhaeribacter aerolatus]GEO03961.1 hypothetical protein AAE02nite_16250 [Adhaeribacter aerolatus]
MLKKITDFTSDFIKKYSLPTFKYQEKLTNKLDKLKGDFDQNIVNEIVLWKVNRYAEIPEKTLAKINQIDKNSIQIDEALTFEIVGALLKSENKGFGLPMVSTILRFKNPYIYQIIDQRVYRFIYGKNLDLKSTSNHLEIDVQTNLYLKYLIDLRKHCDEFNIPFKAADRILYLIDKDKNKDIPLNKYGNRKKI